MSSIMLIIMNLHIQYYSKTVTFIINVFDIYIIQYKTSKIFINLKFVLEYHYIYNIRI